MRVHGDDRIEQRRQPMAHDALADRLAGRKRRVLAHVGQVRGHQAQMPRTQLTRCGGRQQKLGQFVVGVVQAAQHHHARRQVRRQCQPDFAVWKTVALDLLWHQARGNGQAQRGGRLVFKVQQGGGI